MIMSNKLTRKLTVVTFLLFASLASSASDDWIYTVKQGDNFWNLAEEYLVDVRYWRKLQQLNGVTDTTHMPPGSKIKIPLKWSRIQPSEATIKKVSGNVSVKLGDSGDTKKVTSGMKLKVGDEILTESESSATLVFGDGSILVLREDSDLTLETLESYGDEDVFNSQLKLNRGRTDNEVNPFKKPGSRFEIRTPSATAAVRGTIYRVAVPDAKTTITEVLKGKVGVANSAGKTLVPGSYGSVAKLDTPPTPPIALLPAPDLSEVSDLIEHLPLRFTLPEIENASAYRIQITTDPAFQTLDYEGITPTPSAKIAELPDGKYLMKVRGIDDKDLEGFDTLHTFVLNAKPEAPFPVKPQPEATVPVGYNEFSWSESKGVSNYHFQVADNAEFTQTVVDLKNNQGAIANITKSLEPGEWFWRVAAIDTAEGSGPFGEAHSFRVMKPSPVAETPAMSDTEIVFRWPAGEEGDKYQIQVARDDTFETLVVDELITESRYVFPRPEESGNIYMRTKLIDSDGFEGSWSTPQNLEIPAKPPVWLIGVLPLLMILL